MRTRAKLSPVENQAFLAAALGNYTHVHLYTHTRASIHTPNLYPFKNHELTLILQLQSRVHVTGLRLCFPVSVSVTRVTPFSGSEKPVPCSIPRSFTTRTLPC